MLDKLGLFQSIPHFLQFYFNWSYKAEMKNNVERILDIVSKFEGLDETIHNIDNKLTEIDLELTSRIISLVGLNNMR